MSGELLRRRKYVIVWVLEDVVTQGDRGNRYYKLQPFGYIYDVKTWTGKKIAPTVTRHAIRDTNVRSKSDIENLRQVEFRL